MAKRSIAEKYLEHEPFEVLGIKPVLDYKAPRNNGEQGMYRVKYQTPFGEMGGIVDPLIYKDAERLQEEGETGVVLTIRPRSEQPKGQFVKGGFWFQFDIVAISRVPEDYGEKPSSFSKSATKSVASSFT